MVTTFFPLYVYGDFSRHSRAANSAVLGPIWPNFGLVPDVMDVLVTCKIKKIRLKIKALEWSQDFTYHNPMGAICCHGNQSSDLMQPFPHPNDASDKMWLQLAFWLRRYTCLKVLTHTQTDGQTDAGSPPIL